MEKLRQDVRYAIRTLVKAPGFTVVIITPVGVAPVGFYGTDRGIVSDFWVPLAMTKEIMPDLNLAMDGVGRTKRDNQWLTLNAPVAVRGNRAAEAWFR